MSISEFLLARITEDEQAARSAASVYDQWDAVGSQDGQVASVVGITGTIIPRPGMPIAQHIANHDPARVLHDCAAKRGLIRDAGSVPTISMRRALRWISLPYSGHPDYEPDWVVLS